MPGCRTFTHYIIPTSCQTSCSHGLEHAHVWFHEAVSSHLQRKPHKLSFSPNESLPPGSSQAWPTWSSLNRLRTGTGRYKSLMQKWGFNEDGHTTCEYADEQTMKHLLACPIPPQPCTYEDLEEFNPELDPVPSIGRESCSDSRRRRLSG